MQHVHSVFKGVHHISLKVRGIKKGLCIYWLAVHADDPFLS